MMPTTAHPLEERNRTLKARRLAATIADDPLLGLPPSRIAPTERVTTELIADWQADGFTPCQIQDKLEAAFARWPDHRRQRAAEAAGVTPVRPDDDSDTWQRAARQAATIIVDRFYAPEGDDPFAGLPR